MVYNNGILISCRYILEVRIKEKGIYIYIHVYTSCRYIPYTVGRKWKIGLIELD